MAAAAVDTAAAHRVHWLRMIEVFRAEKDVKAAAKAEAECMLRVVSPKACHACMYDARADVIHRSDDAFTLVYVRAFVCCVEVVEFRSRPAAADAYADDAVVAPTEAEADALADVYALTRHPSDANGNTSDNAAADAPADDAADAPADDPADAPAHADGGCYSCS